MQRAEIAHEDEEDVVLGAYRHVLRRRLRETVRYQERWRPYFARHHVTHACEFPRLVSAARYRDVSERVGLVLHYLRALPALAFGGSYERMARYLRLTPAETRWFAPFWSTDPDVPMARPDALVWADRVAILEANTCSSIGGFSHEHLRRYFAEHPAFQEALADLDLRVPSPYDGIAELLAKRAIRSAALVDPPGEAPDGEGDNMRRFLAERGIEVRYDAPRPPVWGKGRATQDGDRVDAVLRMFRATPLRTARELAPLRSLVRRGKVRLLFSPIDRLLSDKQLLALLSDPDRNGFLPPAHRALVQRSLPWTRLVRSPSCTVRFLLENRRRLVLKRGDGAASTAVSIGALVEPSDWAGLVRRARREQCWVVQEAVMRRVRRVPAIVGGELVDYVNVPVDGPYVIDGQAWGGLSKMSGYYASTDGRAPSVVRRVRAAAPLVVAG